LADAAPTRLLPIIKAAKVDDDASTPTAYIVALKPNTVNPLNRGPWLDKVFAASDASLSDDEKSTLHLGWKVFNGIAGQFNTNALNALRAHEDVEYIQESTRRLSYLPPVLTVPFLSSQASPCVSSTSFVKSTHPGV